MWVDFSELALEVSRKGTSILLRKKVTYSNLVLQFLYGIFTEATRFQETQYK